MNAVFHFGERVAGYGVNVLNEREVRASAGILFFFAIRVLVNPRYSPSLVLGRFVVRNHVPEFVGATQKRFTWSIGLALAAAMLYLVVINQVIGPINLIICATCLLLLFFESAFGICLACKVYNVFHKDKAALCPGGTCEVFVRHDSQKIAFAQIVVFILFVGVMAAVAQAFNREAPAAHAVPANTAPLAKQPAGDDCTPPDWAVKLGHSEQWKLHHNCK